MGEWLFHRYVLHGLGKHKDSFWSFHCFEHHKICLQNDMFDPGYREWPRNWNSQAKELFVTTLMMLLHLPLFFIIPGFAAGFYFSLALYYFRHRRAHLDSEWAKRHLPWHYDHHMNPVPLSENWCTTWPWFDYVMGTREKGQEMN